MTQTLHSLTRSVLILCLAAFAMPALANPPVNTPGDVGRYIRVPVLDQGHEHTVATTSGPLLNDTGSYSNESDLWLLEWGTVVSIECVLRTCVCMAMDDDSIAIGDDGANTLCGDMTDTGTPPDSTGGNACRAIPAGGRVEFIISREHWGWVPPYSTAGISQYGAVSAADPSGYRSGYCAATDATPYYPCDAADDCRNAANDGNGTCTDSATSFSLIAGAFLIIEGAGATACFVSKDL